LIQSHTIRAHRRKQSLVDQAAIGFNFVTIGLVVTNVRDIQRIGLVYTGLFDARPRDEISFGLARIAVNDNVRRFQERTNAVNGVSDYNDSIFQPEQDKEYNAELHYGFHLTDWINIRPNLQYIWDPGGVREVDDALVFGLKLQVQL